MARAAVREVDIIPRSDTGYLDAHYPNGVVSSTFSISTIPDIVTIRAAQSYAEDFSTYVSGAGGWTMTFIEITGTLAGVGLSAAGNSVGNLEPLFFAPWQARPIPGNTTVLSGVTTAGSVFLKLQVTKGAETHFSNIFQRTVVQPTDALAPTTGTGLIASLSGTTATIIGDWPSDITAPGILATGMARVKVEQSVNGGAFSPLATIVPANLGASPPMVSTPIGGATGTPIQSGRSFNFTTTGGLMTTTASDTCDAIGAQMQGDYELIGVIQPYTSAYGFSGTGIMIRGDNSAGAAYVRIVRRPNGSGNALSMIWRAAAGALPSPTIDVIDPAPGSDLIVNITKSGNTYTVAYWTGSAWSQMGTAIVATGQTTLALAYAYSGAAVTITPVIYDMNINILGQWSTTTTVANGTTATFRFTSQDVAGNTAAYSATASVTPVAGTLDWQPGMYVGMYKQNSDSLIANWTSAVNSFAATPEVKGIVINPSWRSMQSGSTTYTLDFIQDWLNWCSANNKYFYMYMIGEQFNTTIAAGARVVPDYLLSYQVDCSNSVSAKWWDATLMGEFIKLTQAIAARYGNHPNFHGVSFGETAYGFNATHTAAAAGYSESGLLQQLQRWVIATRIAMPTKHIRIAINYFNHDSTIEALIKTLVANKGAAGGPDTWQYSWVYPPNSTTNPSYNRALPFDEIMRGWRGPAGISTSKDGTLTDNTVWKNQLCWAAEMQATELGGYIGTFTPQQGWQVRGPDLGNGSGLGDQVQYFFIQYNTFYGGAAQQWSTGERPFIQSAASTINTTRPPGY